MASRSTGTGEAEGRPQPASQCPATKGNAIQFVEEVKARASPDRPELFEQFLAAFMEFYGGGAKSQVDEAVPRILKRMEEIFKDDPDLLEKFKSFTPAVEEDVKEVS